MKVNLHVDEIVLSGVPISPADTPLVKQAIEHRLAEMFAASRQIDFATQPRVQVDIQIGAQPDAVMLGRDLAEGLYYDHPVHAPGTGQP